MAEKVQVIVTDDTGKDIPFGTKTLTKEFKNKAGKVYAVAIQEPGKARVPIGNYTVQGTAPPPPCGANEHRDSSGNCVCNTGFHRENGVCVPDAQPEPCPPGFHRENGVCVPDPEPGGDLLYDSNTDINWGAITGEFLRFDEIYGTETPNGKYIRCNASGNPRGYLYPATKEIVLEHDGKYGRFYFGVCNYESRIEIEFKLDSCGNKLSLKSRNRHQFGDVDENASNERKQGGQGGSIGCGETDADLEIYHDGGGEVSGPSGSISPKLEANKYYKLKFSQFDKDGKIAVIMELDRNDGNGFVVINEGDLKPPSQFFNKAEFLEWSEFWVRYNTPKKNNQRLTFKNLRMYKL